MLTVWLIPQHAQHSTRCIDINEAARSEIRQLKTLLPKMEDYVPQIKDAIKEISSIVKNVGDNQKKIRRRWTLFSKKSMLL